MGRIGVPELVFIGLIIILLFGAKKLPEIGSALGKAIREFKKAGNDVKDEAGDALEDKNNEKKS